MTIKELYIKQIEFQQAVLKQRSPNLLTELPVDSLAWFSYHIQAMVEELGEIMKADKRWKTHRNVSYNVDEKHSEIADVIITAMNIAIFSGVNPDELANLVSDKIDKNMEKLTGGNANER